MIRSRWKCMVNARMRSFLNPIRCMTLREHCQEHCQNKSKRGIVVATKMLLT